DAIGLLGLMFLMALAGMEVNLKIMRNEKKAVTLLSVLTFLIPAIAGYAVYNFFQPSDTIGKFVYASLFASHSVGIVFPIIRELNVVKTRFGISVLASTVITDIASLILLAICIQFKRHQNTSTDVPNSISIFDKIGPEVLGAWFPVVFMLTVIAFIVAAYFLIPIAARKILNRIDPNDDSRLTFFLAGLLFIVFIGELIGINIIVSAFIGGMAMVNVSAMHEHGHVLHKKIEGLGYGFMVPFLFLSIGMKTDLTKLVEAWESVAIVIVTVIGLISSKLFSGWLSMRLSGFNNKKGICAGLMTIPQLSATLAAAAVALELKMITEQFFNAIVCLSIFTTLPIPTLVKLMIVKGKMTFEPTSVDTQNESELYIDEDLI
ncbi:MAG: cation:proton antiporter, partial [Lentisphaeria bacterium]